MVCATFSEGRSIIHRIDPRARIVVLVLFATIVAVSTRLSVVVVAAAVGAALVVLARLPAKVIGRRLLAVNGFMVVLLVVLPATMGGRAIAAIGPVTISAEGLHRAVGIALKANAVVLAITALLSTMHLVTAGHALGRLRAPAKLVHLLFFTVRYSDILHHEHARLRRAVRVRGFRPGLNRHTYRAYGYMVGMLLVRSFDRAGRILDAMKCRGFTGKFIAIDRLAFGGRDVVFTCAGVAVVAALAALEWL